MQSPRFGGGFFMACGGSLVKRHCRMDYKTVAEVAAVALAGSEVLSFVPSVKANGWVQLGIEALRLLAQGQKQKRQRRR